jgi:putative ABC transport system permease protein
MWGNIKLLVTLISSAVVFTLLLVTASTMSMAIRERFRELAILKAIGFRRRELFAVILAESFFLAAAGAVLGVGGAWALFTFGDIATLTNGLFPMFEVTQHRRHRSLWRRPRDRNSIMPSAVARLSVVEGCVLD